MKRIQKTCKNGHIFFKSSDCLVCPICEDLKKPKTGFLAKISAPARRALESIKVSTLSELSKHSEEEISNLHGMGPKGVTILRQELHTNGLSFKK